MKKKKPKDPVPIRGEPECAENALDRYEQTCSRLWEEKLKQLPLTLDFDQFITETNVSRSKYFEMVNERHVNFDPRMPRGFPLYDSERSPRVWWAHRVIAWLMHREETHRT
jgi:hypothetical protein